jgi:SAM-dependent methyltransferase
VDLPRSFTIRESGHRIHNPLTSRKLATLGEALNPPPGARVLDLACGSGELLCTWARDHRITGTGVDISTVFLSPMVTHPTTLPTIRSTSRRALVRPGSEGAWPAPWTCSGAACAPAACC